MNEQQMASLDNANNLGAIDSVQRVDDVAITKDEAVIELIKHLNEIRFKGYVIELPDALKKLAGV